MSNVMPPSNSILEKAVKRAQRCAQIEATGADLTDDASQVLALNREIERLQQLVSDMDAAHKSAVKDYEQRLHLGNVELVSLKTERVRAGRVAERLDTTYAAILESRKEPSGSTREHTADEPCAHPWEHVGINASGNHWCTTCFSTLRVPTITDEDQRRALPPNEIRALIEHIEKAGFIYSYEPIFEAARTALPPGVQCEACLRGAPHDGPCTDVLRAAIGRAYGYLWHVNNEPGTPGQYPPERAAYEARKILRDLLSHEERGQCINDVRAELTKGVSP